jgi:two-component system, NarL family, sensor histidine kinase UhpB
LARDPVAFTVDDLQPAVGASSDEAAGAPPSPETCTRCENGPFVRQVLGELDRALADTRQYRDRVRLMSSQILTAQEEERKRIARELHDDTAQALTSVLVRLRVLERSADDAEMRAGLNELRDLTRTTLDGVRRMSVDLRPRALDDLGLKAALKTHIQDFSELSPIRATFAGDAVTPLPPDVELVLYRVAQEALANVAKHSRACRVQVRLTHDADTLRLLVEDDGRGFDARDANSSRESGLGLFGMEERLALIGGALRVDSTVGGGTRVLAEVPLPRCDRG